MYENSSSPVSARQQQHEAEILRRMSAARSSAFNVVAPYSLETQQQNISKGNFYFHHLYFYLSPTVVSKLVDNRPAESYLHQHDVIYYFFV